ncbi:LptA/OstA family protein [Rubellimicrobium aerolatum]|uniref:LptA/OstA family protein n=1 Tax=Rubellimicrobium aerolatum TaxID=490979 RepID=A0ABW0SA62_9RHOB|nr:LptA/OstA family protein [Rubellimicrobium aerolatum]MBP1805222.1 lipopolysaccharide export system protein LptA [Rubellimicrobium aerolatum]
MFRLRVLVLALLIPGGAVAQGVSLGGSFATDPAAPVEVTADSLSVDQATGAATFTGDVVIGQGGLRLSAGTVEVFYDAATGAIARLLASGGVTLATPDEAAEAEGADYDLTARTLILTGDVLLTQGQSAVSGERLVVDLDAGTARMEGRVRTVLGGPPP